MKSDSHKSSNPNKRIKEKKEWERNNPISKRYLLDKMKKLK